MTSTSAGLTMLTTGVSQYLHPDYLQPLPTTLDAKKSPLALLAQTCSAIGKDTSAPSKSIIPPLEKNKDTSDNNKSSSDNNNKSDSEKRPSSHGSHHGDRHSSSKDSSSGRDSRDTRDAARDSKPGFRSFPPKELPPLVPISGGNNNNDKPLSLSASDAKSRSSPSGPSGASVPSTCQSSSRPVSAGGHSSSGQRTTSRNSGKSSPDHPAHHAPHRPRDSPPVAHHHSSRSSHSPYSKLSSSSTTPVMSSPSASSLSLTPSSSSALRSSIPHHLTGLPTPAHLPGYPNPLALIGHGLDPASQSYHSALAAAAAHSSLQSYSAAAAAAQSSALKAAAAAGAPSALSPYVTYARVRTPSGATTLVPVCRDPYCTNCQLTVQNSHLSATCQTPACSQCAHEKSLTSLSQLSMAGAPPSMLGLPPISIASSLPSSMSASMSALSSLHSLYPHGSSLAAHQAAHAAAAASAAASPYVCTWFSGSDYCGKRYTNQEELLNHLRTHTSSLDTSSALAASYASLGLPSALAAYPHLAAPAPLSPNSLRRSYPTSLSPVSSLLGASRYHPYKSPLSAAGTPPGGLPQALPPVGPYYSPYTLYGQRLGAAVVP